MDRLLDFSFYPKNLMSDILITSVSTGLMAEVLDEPPLNVDEMRTSWQDLRMKSTELPDARRLASIYTDLQNVAIQEDRSLQSVSSLIATGALQLVSSKAILISLITTRMLWTLLIQKAYLSIQSV